MGADRNVINKILATRVAHLRIHNGKLRRRPKITQRMLADALGIQRTTIANIESERQTIPLPLIYDIANFFGVPVSQLLPTHDELQSGTGSNEDTMLRTKVSTVVFEEDLAELVNKELGESL